LRFTSEVMEAVEDLGLLVQLRSAIDGQVITTIRETLSARPLERGRSAMVDLTLPNLQLRPTEISLYAALGHVDCRFFYDVIDSNVDLPLIIVSSETLDTYARQGIVSLDHRIEPVPSAEREKAL